MNENNKTKIAKSFLVDIYLNSFHRRFEKREEKLIILFNYFVIFLCLVFLIEFSLGLIIDFKYETKLYIFDITMFFGGIEKYNKIFCFFSVFLGFILVLKLRINAKQDTKEWMKLFETMRTTTRPTFLVEEEEKQILEKVIKFAKPFYKLIDISFVNLGKIKLNDNFSKVINRFFPN